MKWVLYDFKSAKESWFEDVKNIYLKKINHFIDFDIQHLKTIQVDRAQAAQKIKYEESILLEKLKDDDYIIVFDENGKDFDSIKFAEMLQKAQASGKKRGVFLIGGAFGLSLVIKKKAQVTVSLSSLVMNHLIAETVILEQIYRAHTILNRIPYHNA